MTARPASTSVPTEKMGVPGLYYELWTKAFRTTDAGKEEEVPATGPYRVTAYFERYGAPQSGENEVWFEDDARGDSHWLLGAGPFRRLIDVQVQPPGGAPPLHLGGYVNDAGRLARLVASGVQAEGMQQARTAALSSIMPLVARWSFDLDVPMKVVKTTVVCEKTSCANTQYRASYPTMEGRPAPPGAINPRHQAALALYHEGLACNNANYAFLCFYRVANGLLVIRAKEAAEAKGKVPGQESHRFPDDVDEWGPDVKSVAGRKFTAVRDDELREVRNLIAHALEDEEGLLALGNPALELIEAKAAIRWLPVVKHMARTLLLEEVRRVSSPAGSAPP